jgi:hypothetical protein
MILSKFKLLSWQVIFIFSFFQTLALKFFEVCSFNFYGVEYSIKGQGMQGQLAERSDALHRLTSRTDDLSASETLMLF